MSTPSDLNRRLHDAFAASHLTVDELWLRYFSFGGDAGRLEVDAYVNGAIVMPPMEHDMLAHAINERLDEITPVRAPYSEDLDGL